MEGGRKLGTLSAAQRRQELASRGNRRDAAAKAQRAAAATQAALKSQEKYELMVFACAFQLANKAVFASKTGGKIKQNCPAAVEWARAEVEPETDASIKPSSVANRVAALIKDDGIDLRTKKMQDFGKVVECVQQNLKRPGGQHRLPDELLDWVVQMAMNASKYLPWDLREVRTAATAAAAATPRASASILPSSESV